MTLNKEHASTLTFWGVRGSIPAPGLSTITFGGNTSCVSIEHKDTILIFDAGSGIRRLGNHLMRREDLPAVNGNLFVTHTHWDHIQGLPFFAPVYMEKNRFSIHGEKRDIRPLPELLEDQMQAPYFPIGMTDAFDAHISFHEFSLGDSIDIAPDIRVVPFRTRHPNLCVGYVAELGDTRIAYVPDHEHPLDELDANVLKHVSGVDILIHDSQYSRREISSGKAGWGHSAWEDVVDLAVRAEVGELYMFHHDPDANDDRLNERQFMAQKMFSKTFAAREGLKIPLCS